MDIKKALHKKGITIQAAATEMGVDRVTLSRTINNNPTINTLRRLADVCGIDVIDFFADELKKQEDNTYICPHCGKPIKIDIKKG